MLRMLATAIVESDVEAARNVLEALRRGTPRGRPWSPRHDVLEAVAARDWGATTTTRSVLEALGLPGGRASEASVGASLQRAGYRRERVSSGGGRGYVYRRDGAR